MNISSSDLINSKEFVREPVDDFLKKIKNNSSKKIIINGGDGIGKSVAISALEKSTLATESPYISLCFDTAFITFKKNKYFGNKFFTHFYEMSLAAKLLRYINYYYSLTYRTHFSEYDILLNGIIEDTYHYINNCYSKPCFLNKYLSYGEISLEIIDKFRSLFNVSEVNIAIDDFDKINNTSELSQQKLSEYFDKFNHVVLASSDENFIPPIKRGKLIAKGYSFSNINYNSDVNVVKEIIRKRINLYNQCSSSNNNLPVALFSEDVCSDLINLTDGNIKMILEIVNNISMNYDSITLDFDSYLDKVTNKHIAINNQVKKIGQVPKLYL